MSVPSHPVPSNRPSFDELTDDGRFAGRHLGPREADRAAMLATLGYDDDRRAPRRRGARADPPPPRPRPPGSTIGDACARRPADASPTATVC